MPEENLFKQLDVKHPDYEEWSPEWEIYRDVSGDVLVDKEEYLPRGKQEPQDDYDFRVNMSQFMPESNLAVDRILGGLYKEKPKRDLKKHKADLEDFIDKSNRRGESFNEAVKKIARRLLDYGTTRVLINVPVINLGLDENGEPIPMSSLSRSEEKDLGIRPFMIDYSPFPVIDWDHDENEELVFCRIKEERFVRNTNPRSKKKHLKQTTFIDYDRNLVTWWKFLEDEESKEKHNLIDEGINEHGLGMVPLVVEALRDIKPMIGSSYIRYAARADISKFQAESDLKYDSYMHAHPFLAIWSEDTLKEVGVGTSTYLKLNPGQGNSGREDAKYVESPSNAFEALQNIIEESRTSIYRQTQIDPMGQITKGKSSAIAAPSGVSRAWSFGTSESRVLKNTASIMEIIERRIFEIVLRYQTKRDEIKANKDLFEGSVTYPEEFDLSSTSQLITERGQIASMVNSPSLIRILDKRIASSKIGDVPAEELDQVHKEIDGGPLLGSMAGAVKDPLEALSLGDMNPNPPKNDSSPISPKKDRPQTKTKAKVKKKVSQR